MGIVPINLNAWRGDTRQPMDLRQVILIMLKALTQIYIALFVYAVILIAILAYLIKINL